MHVLYRQRQRNFLEGKNLFLSIELRIPKPPKALSLLAFAIATAFSAEAPASKVYFQANSPVLDATKEVTQVQVEAVKERAQKAQLEEGKQQKVDASLAVAEANVARIIAARERTRFNQELATAAEARVEDLNNAIAKLSDESSEKAAAALDATTGALKDAKAELAEAQTVLKEFQGLNARRTEQASKFAQTLAGLKQQRAELDEQLKAAPVADENPVLLEASVLELQSGIQWGETEATRIQSENDLFDAEQKAGVVASSIEFWTLNVKRTQQRTDALEATLAKKRSQDTQRAVADAKAQIGKAPAILKPFAQENARIANLATAILEPARKVKADLTEETARLIKIQRQFTATVDRVDAVGETASVGAYLRNRKTEIPHEDWLSPLAAQHIQDIEFYQSEQFDLQEKLQTLIPDSEVDEILAQASELRVPESQFPAIKEATLELVNRRKDLLTQAVSNHKDYLASLTELKRAENALSETTRRFHEYINERILWIRSNDVLFTKFAKDKSDGVIFSLPGWVNSTTMLGKDLLKNVLLYSLATIVFLSLFVYRFKLRQRVKINALQVARGTNTDFSPTFRTLLLSAAIAAPFPLALAFLGWRLGLTSPASALSIAIGKALLHAGWFTFTAEFLRQICRQEGLAEKHFGWKTATVAKLKSELNWFVPFGALFSFACSIFYFADVDHESDTIERVVFLAAIGSFTIFLTRILNPQSGMFRDQIAQNPKAWYSQCSSIWFWGNILIPVVLTLMVIVGYYYSAIQMVSRIFSTIIILFTFEIARSLLTRFILLSRRKARIEQSRARLLAKQSVEASEVEGNAQATELQRAADQEAFLAEANATIDENVQRSQKLIMAAVAVGWIISVSIIWADVFPAIRGLDKYALWTATVETVVEQERSTVPTMPIMAPVVVKPSKADGNEAKASSESRIESTSLADGKKVILETKVVSFRHLLMAIFILSISIFAVRNLPAFLDLVLLKHLPVEQSVRHAVKAITGYIILLIGVVAAGRAMYIGWSQIQWLATALTFGLAFGLQEIFANFIAGIILLLERPIRIGDVISVDDVTGTVSKIRIRATTITDIERKEYVVPNKEFITGRVLNWTLSDKVNRMTVRVGVAYGSDVRKAKQLLKEICENHPLVVESPATFITFEEFGDSSLNLTARTFVKDYDARWPALDEINLAIDDAFREAGIEIAFPQRDLHIRTASPEFEASVRSTMQPHSTNGIAKEANEVTVTDRNDEAI